MSRDLCRECERCKARERGLCYYCIETETVEETAATMLEGSA
jgi:hypothetical protein